MGNKQVVVCSCSCGLRITALNNVRIKSSARLQLANCPGCGKEIWSCIDFGLGNSKERQGMKVLIKIYQNGEYVTSQDVSSFRPDQVAEMIKVKEEYGLECRIKIDEGEVV